jgi:two-component system, cell cycle sensor histidine kinase and response regulator CckA
MPGMNGRDLARRLRASHPAVRAVYMSGYTSDVIASNGALSPDVKLVQKPFEPRTLLDKIAEALQSSVAV